MPDSPAGLDRVRPWFDAAPSLPPGSADALALRYDVLDEHRFSGAMRFALGHLPGGIAGLHIVDMGCSNGRVSVFFAAHGAQVTGFDLNEVSLREAAARAAQWGLTDRCRFFCGRSEAMALPDGSADVVFSRSTLQYSDRGPAVAEALRVLRPGGTLILLENLAHNPLIGLYRLARRLRARTAREIAYVESIRGYMRFCEIGALEDQFERLAWRTYHLAGVPVLALRRRHLRSPLAAGLVAAVGAADRALLAALPPLRRLAWLVAIVGQGKRPK